MQCFNKTNILVLRAVLINRDILGVQVLYTYIFFDLNSAFIYIILYISAIIKLPYILYIFSSNLNSTCHVYNIQTLIQLFSVFVTI